LKASDRASVDEDRGCIDVRGKAEANRDCHLLLHHRSWPKSKQIATRSAAAAAMKMKAIRWRRAAIAAKPI